MTHEHDLHTATVRMRRPNRSRQQQAAVAELVPAVAGGRGVCGVDQVRAGDRLEQLQVGRARRVPTGDQAVDDPGRPRATEDEVGPAVPGPDLTAASAAVSRARVTVVPTATTRPPWSRVCRTSAAVDAGTANRSGCGGSPTSGEETPECSSTGATVMPRVARSVTTCGENGLAALAISALPGSTPNTVW